MSQTRAKRLGMWMKGEVLVEGVVDGGMAERAVRLVGEREAGAGAGEGPRRGVFKAAEAERVETIAAVGV